MWCLGGGGGGDIDDFDRFPCVAYKKDKTEGGYLVGIAYRRV